MTVSWEGAVAVGRVQQWNKGMSRLRSKINLNQNGPWKRLFWLMWVIASILWCLLSRTITLKLVNRAQVHIKDLWLEQPAMLRFFQIKQRQQLYLPVWDILFFDESLNMKYPVFTLNSIPSVHLTNSHGKVILKCHFFFRR